MLFCERCFVASKGSNSKSTPEKSYKDYSTSIATMQFQTRLDDTDQVEQRFPNWGITTLQQGKKITKGEWLILRCEHFQDHANTTKRDIFCIITDCYHPAEALLHFRTAPSGACYPHLVFCGPSHLTEDDIDP